MVETSTDIFEKIAEGLPAFLKGKEDMSVGELFKALGTHVLIGLLDVIKTLVVGALRVGARVLSDIKDVMNRGIHIPVFSALYKKISGKDLSVLDELSLIIAIPVTFSPRRSLGRSPSIWKKPNCPKRSENSLPKQHVQRPKSEESLLSEGGRTSEDKLPKKAKRKRNGSPRERTMAWHEQK